MYIKLMVLSSNSTENQPAVHLTAESSAPEVKLWLKSKGFSERFVAQFFSLL